MTRLLVAVLRDLRASWGRSLAVALLLAAGVGIYVGLYAAVDSLLVTRDDLYAEGRLADLEVGLVPEDEANVPDLGEVPGVAAVERRLVLPGNIPLADGRRLPALLYFLEGYGPRAVDRLTVLEGDRLDPERPNLALIDRSLARYHGYRPGDAIEVRVGHKRYELVVGGIVQSPEYLLASAAGDFLIPSKGSLGVVFVSNDLMVRAMGFAMVDSVSLLVEPDADVAKVREGVERALAGHVSVDEISPRERQVGYRFLELDLDSFGQYIPAIVIVFAMVSILATFLTVARLLHARRQEIGTQLALGYSRLQIGGAYLLAFTIVSLTGIAIGLAVAFGLRHVFLHDYGNAIGLPRLVMVMPLGRILGGVIGGLAVTTLATLVPLRRMLALTPVEALRPAPAGDDGGRRVAGALLASVPILRSLAGRYAIRNLRRHGVLTLSSILCMALSLGVAVAYFVSMSSMDGSIDRFLGGATWDVAVDLHVPLWPEDVERIAALPGIARVETQVKGQVQLRREGSPTILDSTLAGVARDAALWSYPPGEGKRVAELEGDELVLETVVAQKLGAGVGERLEVEHQGDVYGATVAGIGPGLSGEGSFAARAFGERVLELEGMSTTLMATLEPGADRERTLAALYDDPDVARVTFREDVAGAFHAIMQEFWAIVWIAAALAIGVAILFVFTSLTLSVLAREGEFATMQALGFGRGTLRGILFAESSVQMLAAVIVAAPVAWGIALYLNAQMSRVWFEVTTAGQPRDFVAVLLPALVLSPIGALPGLRHVLEIDVGATVRKKAAD